MEKITSAAAEYASQIYSAGVSHESSEEYMLPDYMPEVQRIVSVQAKALPEGKFLSEGKAELTGTTAYTVIYADDGGSLVGFSPSSDYSVTAPLSCPEGSFVTADTKITSVSCRATAPRRLNLKSKLQTSLRALCKSTVSDEISGADGGPYEKAAAGIERLLRRERTMEIGGGMCCTSFDGVLRGAAGLTPLYCDGAPCITEVKTERDCVRVRGELYVKCTCRGDGDEFITVGDRIQFEDTLDCAGMGESAMARCWGRCASLTVTPTEGGTLECSGEIDLECEWMTAKEISLTEDMYSTCGDCRAKNETLELLAPAACGSTRLSVGSRLPCSAAAGSRVISCSAEASASSLTSEDGRLFLSGSCIVKAVTEGEEKAEREFTLPFKCRFDSCGDTGGDELIYRTDVCVIDCSVRIDGNSADVNAELFISLGAAVKRKADAVVSAVLRDGEEKRDDVIKICYTDGSERLWDIAKRHRVPIDELRRTNGDDVGGYVIIC